MGSIPIARSITSDDSNGLTWPSRLNPAQKWSGLDRSWTGPKRCRREASALSATQNVEGDLRDTEATSTDSLSGMLPVPFDEYIGLRLKAAQLFGVPLFEMVCYLFERMDSLDEFFDFTK